MRCFVTGLLALFIALPRAAFGGPAESLGPITPIAEPRGGYVGTLVVKPEHAVAGTPVQLTASGLPPGEEFELAWSTVKGAWNAGNGEYRGRDYRPAAYRIASARTDSSGSFTTTFRVPEDYGFTHDIAVQREGRLYTKAGFDVDMTVNVSPSAGPVGTPITVEVKGIGWRHMQNSWLLLYDNRFTGWVSAVTTPGSAKFTIPAAGRPGKHVIEVLHGDFTFAYRNMQQSPEPGRPQFARTFTITPGKAVLPPRPEHQLQKTVRSLPAPGDLVAEPALARVGQPIVVRASGFTPDKTLELQWSTVTGNRVGANAGWEESSRAIASARANARGEVQFRFAVPDDLGGAHTLTVDDGARKRQGAFWLTPSALPLDVARGPAGTKFLVHLKGGGWTETGNIYAIVYDNNYIGYACGFNSQGDIQAYLQATGEPGWHFVDLYPAIYKGKETRPLNFRIPQLTYEADHPGEDLPRLRFAFQVTSR